MDVFKEKDIVGDKQLPMAPFHSLQRTNAKINGQTTLQFYGPNLNTIE